MVFSCAHTNNYILTKLKAKSPSGQDNKNRKRNVSNKGRRKNLKELTIKHDIVFDHYNTGVTRGKKLKNNWDNFLCKHRNFLTNPLSQLISPLFSITLTIKLPTKINKYYETLCTKSCSYCSSKNSHSLNWKLHLSVVLVKLILYSRPL